MSPREYATPIHPISDDLTQLHYGVPYMTPEEEDKLDWRPNQYDPPSQQQHQDPPSTSHAPPPPPDQAPPEDQDFATNLADQFFTPPPGFKF
jgi:hypothetical protein